MIDITFEIGGRKVNPNQIGNVLEKALLQEVSENIKKSLRSLRCAEHGQTPKVKVKGSSLEKLSFEVTGCCQPLIDKALTKLK